MGEWRGRFVWTYEDVAGDWGWLFGLCYSTLQEVVSQFSDRYTVQSKCSYY